ncbi:class I SAM-dependent methyltransferase [Scytonema tolypothrichoides VB-61278]|nr:class I SAM-dependent methyltransferase [Scytonema tolypothrichoides VB-61278]
MGKRWGLEKVSTVLDVGCGIGHWGQMLADILPSNAKLTGIDKEAQWVEQASERAKALNLAASFLRKKLLLMKAFIQEAAISAIWYQVISKSYIP